MKKRVVMLGSYVVPLVLVAAGAGLGTQRVLQEGSVRTAAQSVRAERDQTAGPGPTDDVAIVGDSITEVSEQSLRDSLGSFRTTIRGRGGYRIEEMEPYAIELSTTKPEQVIINLGTNDMLVNWPTDESVKALERMVETFSGAKCIHLVTINEALPVERNPDVQERATTFNVEIRRIAEQHKADVIDWAAVVRDDLASGSKKGGVTTDGIHPNSLGKHDLGALVRTALESCK